MKSDAGLSAWAAGFLLFSLCCSASVSSKLEKPFCPVCLQADRLRAVASQLFWSKLLAIIYPGLLQWLLCQAPGVLVSALGLVDPVSVDCTELHPNGL